MPDRESAKRIKAWSERRRAILKTLPFELLVEYRGLGALIRSERHMQKLLDRDEWQKKRRKLRDELVSIIEAERLARTPMSVHRARLVKFLSEHGPQLRREILRHIGIPAGSLSELLKGDEFEQLAHGLWMVKSSK